jgi:hypothetical protein
MFKTVYFPKLFRSNSFIKWNLVLAKEMAMSVQDFEDFENETEEVPEKAPVVAEASPSTRLARRRKIEDLFEEKRLREEIEEFNYL